MAVRLTLFEQKVARELAKLKKQSGSHSPSPAMLAGVSGVRVKHDFCFLSNPYASDLFLKYWRRDFRDAERLRALVEYYPSQNRALARKLERLIDIPAKDIFVGNGATEVIQAVLQHFSKKKILVPVPTFSPYLEFAPKHATVLLHQLRKEADFRLESKRLLAQVKKEKPDTVVIINPNNPDGGYVNATKLHLLLMQLRRVEMVIVDESFIHFSEDADARRYKDADIRGWGIGYFGASRLVKKFPNLVVIKSLSKDFGIAGLRLGYGVMNERRVSGLLRRGYLWNVSGFGEYFLNLLGRSDFQKDYERARLRAVRERDEFFAQLLRIPGLTVYPSRANMFLVELLDGSQADDLMVRLLVRHSIYIRPCGDKVGLHGEFVRIASRRRRENTLLVRALKMSLT